MYQIIMVLGKARVVLMLIRTMPWRHEGVRYSTTFSVLNPTIDGCEVKLMPPLMPPPSYPFISCWLAAGPVWTIQRRKVSCICQKLNSEFLVIHALGSSLIQSEPALFLSLVTETQFVLYLHICMKFPWNNKIIILPKYRVRFLLT